jgi:hypothetical protein
LVFIFCFSHTLSLLLFVIVGLGLSLFDSFVCPGCLHHFDFDVFGICAQEEGHFLLFHSLFFEDPKGTHILSFDIVFIGRHKFLFGSARGQSRLQNQYLCGAPRDTIQTQRSDHYPRRSVCQVYFERATGHTPASTDTGTGAGTGAEAWVLVVELVRAEREAGMDGMDGMDGMAGSVGSESNDTVLKAGRVNGHFWSLGGSFHTSSGEQDKLQAKVINAG